MTIQAQLADGRVLEFPDGTDPSVVQATVKKVIANPMAAQSTASLESAKAAPFSFGDIAKSFGSGVVGGAKSLVDVVGAGSGVSQGLGEAQDYLQRSLSPERQAEIARDQELMNRAQDKGIGSEIMAGLKTVAHAPFQSIAQGVGSSLPAIVGGLVTLPESAPAALALGVQRASSLLIAAAQGVGETKGSIHDEVKKAYKDQGVPEDEAAKLAVKAQEYTLEKAPMLIGSAAFGALDALTGFEKSTSRALKDAFKGEERKLEGKGLKDAINSLAEKAPELPTLAKSALHTAGEESLTEALQGGYGQAAQNIGMSQAGFETPTMQGVGGAAAHDALIGALTGGAMSPLHFQGAKSDYAADQFLRQVKGQQEEDQKNANAIKEQQETRAKTEESLNVPKMLALPAPAKAAEEEKDPLQNPVGRVTEDELGKAIGNNTVVNYLNKYREDNNLPKLKSYSIEDIKDAMTAQNPEGEEGALNSILAYKTNYQNETYTPEDIQNRAVAKNVATETKGFSDFLTRATGKSDLNTMTQPELHSVATALDALPRTGKEQQLVLPEGSNATRFTQDQYNQGVTQALMNVKEGKPVTLDQAREAIKAQTDLKTDRDADHLLKTAASNEDLIVEKGTGFQAVSPGGVVLGTYGTEAEAKRNHRRADILPVDTQLVRAPQEVNQEKVAQLPEGYEINKKTVAGESGPAAYVVREDGSQTNASQTFADEADAKDRLNILSRKREANAVAEEAAADRIRKDLENRQSKIAQMEADGQTDTAEHKNAVAAFQSANVAGSAKITDHLDKAEAFRKPLKIVPLGKKIAKVEKHTVIKKGKEVASFPDRAKAEQHILTTANDAELKSIADRGGSLGKRAEVEMQDRQRTEPGIKVKGTTEGLEKAGVRTPEVEAQLAELKAKLLPMLKKFGLEQVGLNVVREIENDADGAWGKADKLIRIALQATKPIKTMRHEALHALKELGFFTPQQWEALKRQAEKTWVNKYLKGVAFNDTMSRFDAYTAMGLSNEAILEEAIADAFGDWEGGAKPPPGMMAALFKRLQQFFSALRNALTGAGFQSADEIFGKIERGELKAGKESAGTEEKMSLSGIGVPMSTRNLMEVQTPVAQQELGLNTEIKRGRFNNVRDIATALNQYTLDQLGAMDRKDLTQEDSTKIAKAIADEVAFQLNTLTKTGTGLGWYSTNYPNAVKRLANRFPELGTSRHARSVFSAIVAVTSNGERVAKNIDNAIKLYAKLRDGKPMVAMGNRRGTALKNNLAQIQYLLAKHGQDFEKVLLKEITVKEMNAKLSELGEDTDNSYLANTVVPAAAVYFGPKLGAFYANLSGSEGYLTMDLWWTRSINRMRGLLMPKATEASINKFRDMMDRPSATREEVVSATIPFRDKYEEYGFNTELEHLAGSKEPRTNAKKPAWFKKVEEKAGDAFEQMLFDHNIEKMANTIYKNEFEMLEEAPFTATDRKFMYDAARKAQSLLQKEGIDLTLADIQAALWYYEKRLYQKLSGRKADDIGYEEAIIAQANQGNGRARPSVVFDQQPSGGTQPRGAGAEAVGVRGQPAITSAEQGVSGEQKYSIPTGKFTLRPSGKGNKSVSRGRGDTFGFVGPAGLGQAFKEHDVRTNREIGKRPNVEVKQGDGRGFTGFFSNISLGFKGKPNAKPYEPTLNVEPIADFVREYNNHRGNFDDHIATSIPGFREVQTIVGNAIAKTYKNADMLDIGASEGALIKAVTKMSNGGVRTVALDPNFAMAKHFNDGEKIEGSVYDTSAFGTKADEGQLAWNEDETLTDRDGQVTSNPFAGEEVRWFKPDRQFDVIHEAMVFQFISGNRASQIARAKELMKPDGVLIIEEKFVAGDQLSPEQFRANEAQKDAYKEQYFTKAEIAAKAKAVGVAEKAAFQEKQEKKEQQVTGMNDLMVSPGAIEDVLGSNFDHVAQFWDSGNFKGYIASDSPEAVERLINNMLSTDSKFANVKTPRAVKYSLAPSDDGIVLGRLQPDAVEFPGVHYGNVQTDELQGSKYGTGLRGAERRRLQNTDDERIKNRVYFYINKPDGTMPIPESGVGNHVYTQKFKNILGPGKKMTEISKEAGADLNYFEAGIVDAGYDGYAVPEMGMMVILNHNVPVNYRGTRAELSESGAKLSLRTYFPTAEEAENAAYKAAPPATPEFKRFFGASKVKEEGRPQVMYHGSPNEFDTFRDGMPIFISPDPEFAEQFGRDRAKDDGKDPEEAKVYPLWVRAETPFDYENPDHVNKIAEAIIAEHYLKTDESIVRLKQSRPTIKKFREELADGLWSVIEDPIVQTKLKELGFDSFNVKEGGNKNLAVFSANQVKSVTGNIGEFGENKNIKYSLPVVAADIDARVNETTQQREHKGFIDRILGVFAPESLADLRASFIHRYNQLGVYDRMLADKMGDKVLMADMSAEAAANMSDLSASVTYAAFGIGNRQGGIPVYKNGMTTVDTSAKGPLQILSPLAQFNDPKAYQHYQFWAGVKRGSRFMAETSATGVVSYREKNFEPADIEKAERLRKQYKDKGVDFNVIQKEMNTFNDGLVDYMKATGVLAPERAAEFKKHMDYIPFYRQLDGENTVGPKIFNSISGVKPPKKLKGSEAPLTDYLESIVQNTQAAINAGMKNMAAQRAVNVAMQLGKIAGAEKIDGVSSAPDSVTFLENGKAVSYRVADQLFINAVKSLNMAEIPFLGMFSAPSNLLRNLVTKDPGFMLANLARDSLSAWVTSGSNMTPIIGTAANFAKALSGKDPILQALYNAGILGGYEFSSGVMKSAETLEKDLNKKYGSSGKAAPLKVFNGIWDALEKGTEASDAATRMAVYERVLAETGNETEALYRALEVMNFNRKGSSPVVRILTAAIPFLNARVQGLDVFYRTAFGRNVSANAEAMQKAFFVRAATLMALSAAYFLAVSDDDEWKKQEQETKDNYWIAPGIGKFPTPFEVGFLFKTVPERIMAYTLKDDTGQDFMASMQRGLLNTFAFNPIPQIAKPIIEYNANYNFFTGRPIVGQGMEGLEPQYQVGPNTTKTAEALGKALGMPPIKLDQLINSYTGTMGMYAMTLIDSVLDTQSNSPHASKRFEQLPIIKRFASDPEARGNITQYYELKKAVDAATQTENYLLKAGKPDEFREFMEQNKGLLAIKPYVADIEKSMKETREMRKMVQGAEMSGDEKRDILTRIGQKENNLTSNIQTVKKMISELQ